MSQITQIYFLSFCEISVISEKKKRNQREAKKR